MKKSILSLSAAVALGGLGFAGAANAIAIFSDDGAVDNTVVKLHASGTGHKLFTPYYTAQGNMATLINIVNTDAVNGKAVKVRFRGAANSDDVLDFTLLLSPGDVWSGMVSKGAEGRAQVATPDKSCTIPSAERWPAPFNTIRLPSYVSEDAQNALTREGYVEVLNMADIPPNDVAGSLYKGVKHVNGVASCANGASSAAFAKLLTTEVVDAAAARAAGLDNPTGGLMGSWVIYQQDAQGAYSGDQTALVNADPSAAATFNGLETSAKAKFAFSPQVGTPIGAALDAAPVNGLENVTADPLLSAVAPAKPAVTPLWFDLPDMSTPMVKGKKAADQAKAISEALAKPNVVNEYIATAAGAPVPFVTDWVVAQPTRRYYAAVNYGSSAAAATLVQGTDKTYFDDLVIRTGAYGPQACREFTLGSFDREETTKSAAGDFSPGASKPFCGEVFVAQFGAESALKASITALNVSSLLAGQAGWAALRTGVPAGLPVVGFAATQFKNLNNGGITYDVTLPHRWTKAD